MPLVYSLSYLFSTAFTIFHTFEELEKAIDEYIVFYNTRRLQAKLKGLAPLAFRNQTLEA